MSFCSSSFISGSAPEAKENLTLSICIFAIFETNKTEVMTMPTATAVIKSTKTVSRSVVNITTTPGRGNLMMRFRFRQSMISIPTLSKIPPRTDNGI